MFYDTLENNHGLKHDPFKALVVPRPIGWISTVSNSGQFNIAPYSFFNAMSDRPHYVAFGTSLSKDSERNINETGEFVCNLASADLAEHMNMTSATVPHGVDEFKIGKLTAVKCNIVKAPRVKEAAASLECKHFKTIELPGAGKYRHSYNMIIGLVVGIHIDDRFIKDGNVDTTAMKPLGRLGYMDYTVVTAESMFEMNRPTVGPDGAVQAPPKTWDGVYR